MMRQSNAECQCPTQNRNLKGGWCYLEAPPSPNTHHAYSLRPTEALCENRTFLLVWGSLRDTTGGIQVSAGDRRKLPGGSNSTLALPVWTSVERAIARNNLWLLHLSWLMPHYFFSAVLHGGVGWQKEILWWSTDFLLTRALCNVPVQICTLSMCMCLHRETQCHKVWLE